MQNADRKLIATVTADIHARATAPRMRVESDEAYCAEMVRKLRYISAWRRDNGFSGLHVDAGDLFNSWKSTPAVEIMLLNNLPENFVSIPGNHEMPYHDMNRIESSSWQVLKAAGAIQEPPKNVRLFPYGSSVQVWEPLQRSEEKTIAVYHGMVWDGDKPDFDGAEGYSAGELLDILKDFDFVITGHNHRTFSQAVDGRVLINPGSLMRSSIDQQGHAPSFFALYSDGSFRQIKIPVAEDVFKVGLYEAAKERDARMEAFVSRVQRMDGFSADYAENIRRYCQQNAVAQPVRDMLEWAVEK